MITSYDLCFKICSPIHIGFNRRDQNTSIANTRPYIPGRTLWGAVTANITRKLHPNPRGTDYKKYGELIESSISLSYLYPAYKMSNNKYEIIIASNDDDDELRKHGVIHSLNSTSIESKTGVAKDKSLHEIKYIRPFIGTDGRNIQPLYLVGKAYLKRDFEKNNFSYGKAGLLYDEVSLFDGMSLGGESNYGYGKVEFSEMVDLDIKVFPEFVRESQDGIIVEFSGNSGNVRLSAHYLLESDFNDWISGTPEILVERDELHLIKRNGFFLPPGSEISVNRKKFIMDSFGKLFPYKEG